MVLGLNKIESTLPKDALCLVWLKLAQWLWRREWKYEKFNMLLPTMTTTKLYILSTTKNKQGFVVINLFRKFGGILPYNDWYLPRPRLATRAWGMERDAIKRIKRRRLLKRCWTVWCLSITRILIQTLHYRSTFKYLKNMISKIKIWCC